MPRSLKSLLVPALCAGTFLGLSAGLPVLPISPPRPHAAARQLVGYVNGGRLAGKRHPF
jgi:hypothetical protein